MINDLRPQTGREANEFDSQLSHASLHTSSFPYEYHEIAERHVVELDVLQQLKSNIAQLEDMHQRLRFMMSEVRSLIRKS